MRSTAESDGMPGMPPKSPRSLGAIWRAAGTGVSKPHATIVRAPLITVVIGGLGLILLPMGLAAASMFLAIFAAQMLISHPH
jgi:hypothetical protein